MKYVSTLFSIGERENKHLKKDDEKQTLFVQNIRSRTTEREKGKNKQVKKLPEGFKDSFVTSSFTHFLTSSF